MQNSNHSGPRHLAAPIRTHDAFRAANPPPWDDITEACDHGPFSDKLDEHLDATHGSCALRDPRLAPIVADRLHHFDGQRYDLWSDVIMPNHVHVLFTLHDGESLPDTLQSWKAVSGRLIHPRGCHELAPCLHGQALIELRKVGFEHIGIDATFS